AADLEHGTRGNRERRTAAVIKGVGVRHQRAQAVIAAGEREHDEVAARGALGAREIRKKRGRREADRERCRAASDELASGNHTSWYSADPRMRCASPDALVCSCVSDPLHAPVLAYASRSPY